MSEIEDSVTTVVRLLQKNLSVVKDDGSLASFYVSSEWHDRELLKSYDGQITVGLSESRDTKIEMSGRLRRRLGTLRVNVWTQDRLIRNKAVEEVNRIVRQNCNKPNETVYDFHGIGETSGTNKAYSAGSATELTPGAAGWTELINADYEKIWHNDDTRYSKSHDVNG